MIDRIDEKTFAEAREQVARERDAVPVVITADTDSVLAELIKALDKPVDFQKELAAKIKLILDSMMAEDVKEYGRMQEGTRKLAAEYNSLLDSIQRNTIGDKPQQVIHTVTHQMISQQMRKFRPTVTVEAQRVS